MCAKCYVRLVESQVYCQDYVFLFMMVSSSMWLKKTLNSRGDETMLVTLKPTLNMLDLL